MHEAVNDTAPQKLGIRNTGSYSCKSVSTKLMINDSQSENKDATQPDVISAQEIVNYERKLGILHFQLSSEDACSSRLTIEALK